MHHTAPIIPNWPIKIAAIAIVGSFHLGAGSSLANSPKSKFVCQVIDGVPTTFLETARSRLPLIRWTKKTFNSFGYNPQQRCRETSLRLTMFQASGKLKFIRAGITHGYPVLCVDSPTKTGDCSRSDVLLTFDKGTDPQVIRQQLLDLRSRVTRGAIEL